MQELSPSGLGQFAPTATMLTGLGTDEFFQRMDANGAQSFLTDTLGSTLALTNAAAAISTSYTYEPFGNVSINPSATNTNPYQFTGRENDGTGVYFYRARYYSPSTSRFLGQDPLRILRRSANLYQYVDNDPVIFADASGLEDPVCDEIREEIKKLLERRATCNHPAEYKQIEVELEFQKQAFEAFGCNEGPEGDGGGQPIPGDETPSEPEKQAAQPIQDAVLMTILLIIGRWVWVF